MFLSRSSRSLRLTACLGAAATIAAVAGVQLAATTPAQPVALNARTVAAEATLPFDMPSTDVLRASPRKVFAHYMPSLPVSLDNKAPNADVYATQYLTPNGEAGKHAAYGGFLRDRPAPRPARTVTSWALADAEDEVRQAIAAGIDGFTLDLLQIPGDPNAASNWTMSVRMMKAAQNVDPGFKVVIVPDMSASAKSGDVAALAKAVDELANYSSAYRLADGRLVVSPYYAEKQTVDWWKQFNALMASEYGETVALYPMFDDEAKWAKPFAPISYGMSHWGVRNPLWNDPANLTATGRIGRVKTVKALGQQWMQPVSLQDTRPRTQGFEEAENTTNLRNTWKIARDSKSDWVQLVTWNDYTEGSQMAVTAKNGWTWLDINAYYIAWYKTGTAPAITRDAVYLTHRNQRLGATPTFPMTKFQTSRGGSTPRNTVEALTFLTAPGQVSIEVAGNTVSCNAPAGVGVCTAVLQPGAIAADIFRGGQMVAGVDSPLTVTASPTVQDLEYVGRSSLRFPAPLPAPVPTETPTTPAPTTPAPTTPAPTTPAPTTPAPTTPAPTPSDTPTTPAPTTPAPTTPAPTDTPTASPTTTP